MFWLIFVICNTIGFNLFCFNTSYVLVDRGSSLMMWMASPSFNTSYVLVDLKIQPPKSLCLTSFNTSYVLVDHSTAKLYIFATYFVSIHPMFWLIEIKRAAADALIMVSIHPMFWLIICTLFTMSPVVSCFNTSYVLVDHECNKARAFYAALVSIHPMFWLIMLFG